MESAARYGSERNPTVCESAIRARFVRDSFHSLSTADSKLLHRLFPVTMWYKRGAIAGKRTATDCGRINRMNKQILKDIMQRVETWPDADQAELLEYALEIE